MGTNFYFIQKKEFEEVTEHNAIMLEKIDKFINDISSTLLEDDVVKNTHYSLKEDLLLKTREIHIGKRSSGWAPLFESCEYYSSVRELKDFYEKNKDDYWIIDENDEYYDFDELKEALIDWNPKGKRHGLNSYIDEDGYEWTTSEFG